MTATFRFRRSVRWLAIAMLCAAAAPPDLVLATTQWYRFRRPADQQPKPHPGATVQKQEMRVAAGEEIRPLAQRDNPQAKKVGTNLKAFGIPFDVADPDQRYIEVQLYMSRDRGQSWNFHGRQPATGTEFPFESRGDGEYWFAIRTLDRDRQLHPQGTMLPELKITVDTVQPQLDFRIQTDAAGRIVCRWRAEDDNIDPATTRLSFRPLVSEDDSNNQWMSVPYKPVAPVTDRTFADQYAWWPEPRSHEVLVQLAISDAGGNQAIEERQIVLPQISTAPGQMAFSTPGSASPSPAAALAGSGAARMYETSSTTQSPGPAGQVTQRPPLASVPPGDSGGSAPPPVRQPRMYGAGPAEQVPSLPSVPGTQTPERIPWSSVPAGGSGKDAVTETRRPVIPDPPPLLGLPQTTVLESSPAAAPPAPESERAPTSAPTGRGESGSPQDPPVLPASIPQPVSPAAPAGTSSGSMNSVLKAPDRIRYINSRRFRMDYSLDFIDATQLSKVVLWMTADGGQTWTAWAEDTDTVSPFPVEMAEPGHYGFRIVFHNNDGLAGRAPLRGDDADLWVVIDLDHPDARLTGAPYGSGETSGRLLIQWIASDAMLRDRPVRLSYSADRLGPWTVIEDGLENSGQFVWKPDNLTPDRVYLRLDVTDAAGNSSTSATDQPIDLTGMIPRGRITDIQPVR